MTVSGFLLSGGQSSRMGRDKALLPFGDGTLLDHLARLIRDVTGSVTVVGPAERYRDAPYAVIEDRQPGLGPLAGIEAALTATVTDWNLIVACDLAAVTHETLAGLLRRIPESGTLCVVPEPLPGDLQPLCALYHRDCLAHVREAISQGRLAVWRLVASVPAVRWTGCRTEWFVNVNTPQDWIRLLQTHE